MTRPEKSCRNRNSNPGSSTPEADALTTRPARWFESRVRVLSKDGAVVGLFVCCCCCFVVSRVIVCFVTVCRVGKFIQGKYDIGQQCLLRQFDYLGGKLISTAFRFLLHSLFIFLFSFNIPIPCMN